LVDGDLQIKYFSACVDVDLFGEITESDCLRDTGDVPYLVREISGELVDDASEFAPRPFDVKDESLSTEFTENKFRCVWW
jgi:hypothetical protein